MKNENQEFYEFKTNKEMVDYWKSKGIDVPFEILDPENKYGWNSNKDETIDLCTENEIDRKENIIIYDWLTFTSKVDTPDGILEFMGLGEICFQVIHGFYGYKNRYYYDGISVHYDGREDMGICIEMSGQGCRVFETFGTGDWESLFDLIKNNNNYNVTRLDVAYDDHTGVLNINKISKEVRKGWYVAKARDWEVVYSSKGISTYIGSKKSETLIRFYDKAKERGYTDKHWIRCEMQLRRDRAFNFINLDMPLGEKYSKVLNNYLRFVKSTNDDMRVRRWKTQKFWLDFVKTTEKISIYTKKEIEYNLSRVERYILHQAGNSIETYIKCLGLQYFISALEERDTRLMNHHKVIIENYRKDVDQNFGKAENDKMTFRN